MFSSAIVCEQILNLLFFVLFGKQLFRVDVLEHALILGQSGLVGRTSCLLADLFFADITARETHLQIEIDESETGAFW